MPEQTRIPHSQALGIHPGAFFSPTEPDIEDAQNGVLWVNIANPPPYPLMIWDPDGSATWQQVGSVSTRLRIAYSLTEPSGDDYDLWIDPSSTYNDIYAWNAAEGNWNELVEPALQPETGGDGHTHDIWGFRGNWINFDNPITDVYYVLTIPGPSDRWAAMGAGLPGQLWFISLGACPRWIIPGAPGDIAFYRKDNYNWATRAIGPPGSVLTSGEEDGLPAPVWSTGPVPVVSTSSETCTQIKCGAAHALTDHLQATYGLFQNWVNAGLTLLLDAGFVVTGNTIMAFFNALTGGVGFVFEPLEWALITGVSTYLADLAESALVPLDIITEDQYAAIQTAAFCNLTCDGDQVLLTKAQLQAWQSAVAALPSGTFTGIQQDFLAAILQYATDLDLTAWALIAAGGANEPIGDCDSYACP